MSAAGSALPHESWADVYDLVLERTFGSALAEFTERTVAVVRERLRAPARVIDFGAGTGRVALPLAAAGYCVTAVDPSPAMLAKLAEKEAVVGCDTEDSGRVACLVSTVQGFAGASDYHMALCVFSVIGYLLDEASLDGAFAGMASALRPGGCALVDVPGPDVFEGFEVESDDVLRQVEVAPVPGAPGLLEYAERIAVLVDGRIVQREDSFRIREWSREEVLDAAARAGFVLAEDLSDRFLAWGADYLLLRRS